MLQLNFGIDWQPDWCMAALAKYWAPRIDTLVCTECIVAKRCVLEQKLLLTAYRKLYMRNRFVPKNDLHLCIKVVSRSRQPLRYIRRWISRKPLEIEAWFQRTTNRKWHIGYQMITWPMTSRDLWGSTVGHASDSLASCIHVGSKNTVTTWRLFWPARLACRWDVAFVWNSLWIYLITYLITYLRSLVCPV